MPAFTYRSDLRSRSPQPRHFCRRDPSLGIAVAFIAIVAAATIPVRNLLVPTHGPTTLYRFTDDAAVTLDGLIVREPERIEDGRSYLYVRAERAGAKLEPLTSAVGVMRVTVGGAQHFTIGDAVRVTSRIRFPRNDGDPGEFDYRSWLLRDRITATIYADYAKKGAPPPITVIGHREFLVRECIEAVREHIGAFIDANLTYPQNAEMRALIIGDRGGIDEAI
jgi:competence protein ComEC